ncbi:MAG TPA: hypothetical protein VFE34_26790 [Dongiaceae bacterium]|nr:hypothetical protein [Dongiaceae bacterium]
MEWTFAAAIEHIRLMENRIAQQEAAIQQLKQAGQDISSAASRLQLLHAAMEEMRIQLARLLPTEEQVAAPIWALPLPNAGRHKDTA